MLPVREKLLVDRSALSVLVTPIQGLLFVHLSLTRSHRLAYHREENRK